jgi:hypothetical protein
MHIKIGPSAQRLRQSVGLCLFTSPTSHLAWKSDPRSRRAAPCGDKISVTRHQWLFAHGLVADHAAHARLEDCQVQKCENVNTSSEGEYVSERV